MTDLERQVSIQVANTEDGSYDVHLPLPYPYHIDDDGNVGRQDFWRGEPKSLIGFQAERDRHEVDLFFHDFWDDPEKAVGMFPVFVDAGGTFWNHLWPVTSVSVRGVSDDNEVF